MSQVNDPNTEMGGYNLGASGYEQPAFPPVFNRFTCRGTEGAFPSAPAYAQPGFPQEGTGHNPGPVGAPYSQTPHQPSQDESGFTVTGENNPLPYVYAPPLPATHPYYFLPYSIFNTVRHPGYGQEGLAYNLGPYAQMPYKQGPLQTAAGYHGQVPPSSSSYTDEEDNDEDYDDEEAYDEEDKEDYDANDYDNTEKDNSIQPFFRKLLMALLVQHLVLFLFAIDNGAMDYMRENLFTSTGFYVAFAAFSAMLVPSCRKRELNLVPFSIVTLSLSYMVGMMFSFNPSATVIMLISVLTILVGITSV